MYFIVCSAAVTFHQIYSLVPLFWDSALQIKISYAVKPLCFHTEETQRKHVLCDIIKLDSQQIIFI